MATNYLQQLKHPDPARRREAIIALGNLGDSRALGALSEVSGADPDPALRELAARAIAYIQRQTGSGASSMTTLDAQDRSAWRGLQAAAQPQPVSPSPAQEAIGERQKAQARSRLNMASNYQVAGQNENAAALLAQAVRFDPALRDDPVAVNLAAVLTGRPADEALAALLAEVDARATERRKVREPVTRNPVAIRIAVIVVELPLLFLALHLFHTVLVIKLTNAPYDGLQALLVSFRPTTISRIAPLAFSSLVLVTLGVFVMYYVGATMLQGEATALRFLSIMLGVEVVSFFLGAVALLIVPLFASVPVSETEVAVIIHVGWAFVLGVGVLFWQAYFAARAQNYSLGAGLMTLFVGAAITIVLWEVLGIRRALRLN